LKVQRPSAAQPIEQSNFVQLFRNVWIENALEFTVFSLAGALGTIGPPGI
jgi:hypothetical protein